MSMLMTTIIIGFLVRSQTAGPHNKVHWISPAQIAAACRWPAASATAIAAAMCLCTKPR
jgi:hypothetical protein